VLCSGLRLRWRPRCITGGRTCVVARVFAAAVVVGGHGGTVCACVLVLAAVFYPFPPLVHDRPWTRVRQEAGCLTFLVADLCTSGRLSLATQEVLDSVRTGSCGSMVPPAPRPISKTQRRRGLRQLYRMCRRTLGVCDDHLLCTPSRPYPWAARTQPTSEPPKRAAGAEAAPPQAVHPPRLGPLPSRPPSPNRQDPRPPACQPPLRRPPSQSL